MPFLAAASAVTCAANGVDLREPLKPADPADSQAITLPSVSVRVTIVLLNEVLMCAWPYGVFFLTRRPLRPLGPFFSATLLSYLGFFLPAILNRRGPLRPRALVLVR